MKKVLFVFILIFAQWTFAQDTLVDPLFNIKSYSTWDMGVYTSSPTVDNVSFGDYQLPQGVYNTTVHSAFYWNGTIMVDNEPLFKIKSGLLINSYTTNLVNTQTGQLYYWGQSDLSIPLLIGTHLPIHYNTVKDKFFKAVDLNFGLYMGTPWLENFALQSDKYNGEINYFAFNYIKFGLIAEVEYSMINAKGYGHRIGLRAMTDFSSIWKFKNSETGIYPSFTSIGIYYNLWTSGLEYRN